MVRMVDCKKELYWLDQVVEAVHFEGYAIVTGVLSEQFIADTRAAMYRAQEKLHQELGKERLTAAGELGVLRLMMAHEPHFFKFLQIPEVLTVIDKILSPTAVMHLQNGFILPSFPAGQTPSVFQNKFHRDVNRVLNGYMASLNIFFSIDEFTATNGATLIVPGTHQRELLPDNEYLKSQAFAAECPAGSMIIFDSTLWHAAGINTSGKDRLAINHQFTRSYFKQQIDYVRALGEPVVEALPLRTRTLLGYDTRVVTSLDEYYRSGDDRMYKPGQG